MCAVLILQDREFTGFNFDVKCSVIAASRRGINLGTNRIIPVPKQELNQFSISSKNKALAIDEAAHGLHENE